MQLFLNERSWAALGALVIIGASLVVATTSPAHAAPCTPPDYVVRGWTSTNTCSTPVFSKAANSLSPDGACFNFPASARNNITYMWNQAPYQLRVYTGLNCTGTSGPLYAGVGGSMAGVYYKNLESIRRAS